MPVLLSTMSARSRSLRLSSVWRLSGGARDLPVRNAKGVPVDAQLLIFLGAACLIAIAADAVAALVGSRRRRLPP
jgi:hypothetical protein